jgi:protein-tyrosine-phosphatase
MKAKPGEAMLMAYLFNELEGEEKRAVEEYLADNPEAKAEFAALARVQALLSTVKDKEVIAPPLVMGNSHTSLWRQSYIRVPLSIAASLLVVMLAAFALDLRVSYRANELRMTFGEATPTPQAIQPLSPEQIQQMITTTVTQNNQQLQAGWESSQHQWSEAVKKTLASAGNQNLDALVTRAAQATEAQVRDYVLSMQTENAKMVKDYMTLTSNEQAKYIEELLVDFGKYLDQQRKNDFQALQTRLSSIEQNTDLFKQETEQILSTIITSVEGSNKNLKNY